MAEDDRTFRTSTPAANRAEMQGLGVGQKELNAQRSPNRSEYATDPDRTEPFDTELQVGPRGERPDRPAAAPAEDRALDDRDAAGIEDAGDLGASTPAGVDIHDVGQDDSPEQDWGEAMGEGALHSANHARRVVKTEAERGQGKRTRQLNKDIVSRRR